MIIEAFLQQCQVPSDLKTVNIVPVHNKRNRSTPSNYRPISLTSKLRTCAHHSHTYFLSP